MGIKSDWYVIGRGERAVLMILLLMGLALTALLLLPTQAVSANMEGVADTLKQHAEAKQPKQKSQDTLITNAHYVGPPAHLRGKGEKKLEKGAVIDLNSADSTLMMRVPGIGQVFARRIIQYREKLGGYYTVMQLQEVFGMDFDRYMDIRHYFEVQTPPKQYRLCDLNAEDLPNHPYLSWKQRDALKKQLRRRGTINRWATLMEMEQFGHEDSVRLSPYFVEEKNDNNTVEETTTEQ